MKGTAKTVELDGRSAREVTITARRDEARRTQDDQPEELRQRREQILSRLLRDTGIPADKWTIRTDPRDADPVKSSEAPTAAVAAILRAHAGAGQPGATDRTVMLGAWQLANTARGDMEITGVRGDAMRLRWAAENGRTAAAPVWQFAGGTLPRNRTTKYHDIRTVVDLQAALTGGGHPEVQEPASGAESPAIEREHEGLLADRGGILTELIESIEEAVKTRRPLLIRTDAESAFPGTSAARLANLISPGMTPVEQQLVLETYDLAGMTPPGRMPATTGPAGRARRPIPRPLR